MFSSKEKIVHNPVCFNYSVMARGWPHSFWQNSTTQNHVRFVSKWLSRLIRDTNFLSNHIFTSYTACFRYSNNYWLLANWHFNSSRFGDLPPKRFQALSRLRFPSHVWLHQYSTDLLFSSRTVFIISYMGVLRAFHRYIKQKLKWKTRRRT